MLSPRTIVAAGSVLGFLAVAIGAFGAHRFKPFLIQTGRLDTFQTGTEYHMYHALALVLVGILAFRFPDVDFTAPALCFLWGVLLFSGSLYLLCGTGIRWMGAITPIGGIGFLAGWALLAWKIWQVR